MASLTKVKRWIQSGDPEIEPDTIDNVKHITEESDLPEVSNGRHQLEDATAYRFAGFVTSQFGLELAPTSPLVGTHGGIDGFICTGGGPAIYGRNANYLQRDMYVHAPMGQVLDIAGDDGENGDEVLVESVSASNAAGIGNAADLGTIDGMRVPSFKGANFEDFNAGLTLTGESDKIFFSETPFRTISDNNVTLLEFDADFETDIVDIVNCYVKAVQADTEVINVNPSATINDVFQFRGTTHDSSVTESNILNGAASVDAVGYRIFNSYPLADSTIVGELSADAIGNTLTIPGQNTWVEVDDFATSLSGIVERVEQSSNGTIQYIGKKTEKIELAATMTVITGGDTIQVTVSKNGTRLDTSLQETQSAAGVPIPIHIEGIEEFSTDDEAEVQVQNVDSASNIEVRTFNYNLKKV